MQKLRKQALWQCLVWLFALMLALLRRRARRFHCDPLSNGMSHSSNQDPAVLEFFSGSSLVPRKSLLGNDRQENDLIKHSKYF